MVYYQVMFIMYSGTNEHDLHSLSSVSINETEICIPVILQAAF